MESDRAGLADVQIRTYRSPDIDVVRGLLAFWVLFAHLFAWSNAVNQDSVVLATTFEQLGLLFQSNAETHPAVLGFIVLSGYCIHRTGFRRRGGSLVSAYATRRFFRIWPVYVLATLGGVGLFLAAHVANPETASSLSGTTRISASCVLAKLTGVSVFRPSVHGCSFQGNAPLTTAMVEEWLYILYAVVFHAVLSRGLERPFWIAVLVAWAAGLVYTSSHPEYLAWWHNGSLLGFLPYWWMGAAFLGPRFRAGVNRAKYPLAAMWVLLTVALLASHVEWLFVVEARKAILACLFGLGVAALDSPEVRAYLRPGALIGRAGYSVYAFHAPLLVLTLTLGARWWIAGAVTVAASLGIYLLYEKPFTDLGKRLAQRVGTVDARPLTPA
jgi:peptidoglycan/LPS O-acetylase OafA/YrhL